MPFNTLLFYNFKRETSHDEDGVTVSIKPRSNEDVIFFQIDKNDDEGKSFRKFLGLDEECKKICDLLIYYKSSNLMNKDKNQQTKKNTKSQVDGTGTKRIICFTELKGKNSKDALEQIKDTYYAFEKKVIQTNIFKSDVIMAGYVEQHKNAPSSPILTKSLRNELEEHGLKVDIQKGNKIENFIRRL